MKKKTPTIHDIFDKSSRDKFYTKNALLKQDILSYYYKVIKAENRENPFRFYDLGMWLLRKNVEFFNYYKGSHVKYRDRFDNRKGRIRNALRDLIELHLIREAGIAKAKTLDSDVQLYEYRIGKVLALLIKGLDVKERPDTNSEIYDLVVGRLRTQEDTSFITISRFLSQCQAKGFFDKLVEYLYYLIHQNLSFKSFHDLFECIFNLDFRGSEVQRELLTMWFETVQKLEPDIRNLMVYGFKLHIERRFENSQEGLSRQYEQLRFDLRADHERIALEGNCSSCKRDISLGVHYSEYIKIITELGHDSIDCPQCNTRGSIVFTYF